jgi:hypothetical protein
MGAEGRRRMREAERNCVAPHLRLGEGSEAYSGTKVVGLFGDMIASAQLFRGVRVKVNLGGVRVCEAGSAA